MKKKYFINIMMIFSVCCLLNVFDIGAEAQGKEQPEAKTAEISQEDEKTAQEQEESEKVKKEAEAAKAAAKTAQAEAEKTRKEVEIQKKAVELEKKKLETEIKETEVSKKEAEIVQKTTKSKAEVKAAIEKAKQEEKEDVLAKEKAKTTEEKMLASQQKAKLAEEELKLAQAKLALAMEKIKAEDAKRSFIEKALESAAIILIGIFLFLLIKLGVRKFTNMLTRKDVIRESEATLQIKTVVKLFNWLGTVVIFIVVIYMVLENHGFNVAPLLAGAGIVGLAFGFGGQYLIRDLINGLFILIEGQYRINDVVKIGEYGGLVEDINLRITTLRDLGGRVIIIPNGEIKTVVNYTREYAQALFDVGVAYKESVDQVMDVIKEVGNEMRKDPYFSKLILDDLEMFGVDEFSDSAVIIKFRLKTLPIKQWEVMREFRRRLKNRFDELGIEIPFPHRTLYWGTGKDNERVKGFADRMAPRKGDV